MAEVSLAFVWVKGMGGVVAVLSVPVSCVVWGGASVSATRDIPGVGGVLVPPEGGAGARSMRGRGKMSGGRGEWGRGSPPCSAVVCRGDSFVVFVGCLRHYAVQTVEIPDFDVDVGCVVGRRVVGVSL